MSLSKMLRLPAESTPIFSAFLPSSYRFGIACKLTQSCFHIYSHSTKFLILVLSLNNIFQKNGPIYFINKHFLKLMNSAKAVKEIFPTVKRRQKLRKLRKKYFITVNYRQYSQITQVSVTPIDSKITPSVTSEHICFIHIHIYIYIYLYICTYKVYIYIYIYVHIYKCIYIYA